MVKIVKLQLMTKCTTSNYFQNSYHFPFKADGLKCLEIEETFNGHSSQSPFPGIRLYGTVRIGA